MKLTAMRGYSGSGKSTRACEIAKKTGAVVVNRDLLRLQLLGSWWTGDRGDEDRVTIAEEAQVKALLQAGVPVVVDATHLEAKYLRKWARLATKLGVLFEVVDVHADPVECRKRVYQRWCAEQNSEFARYLDPKVVDKQAKRHPVEKWPTITADPPFVVEPVGEYVLTVPEAIIVDIDGTVAINDGHRSPYDYTLVSHDKPEYTIIRLVQDWKAQHPDGAVLIVSGRDDSCYADTLDWLVDHNVPVDWLFMRPADAKDSRGNKNPDFLVKHELFNRHIRHRFNVQFVLDDRRQVIDMWRAMDLKVLDVAGNEF